MRKLLLILLFSICATAVCRAASPRRGYRGFYNWDMSKGIATCGDVDDGPVTRKKTMYCGVLDTSHGYQFNSHFFSGLGFMFAYSDPGDNQIYPVYFDFRYDNSLGKLNLFADMRVGANGGSGIYLSPTVGYRLPIGKRMGINFGVGMTVFGESYKSYTYAVHYYNQETGHYQLIKDKYLGKIHNTNKMFTIRIGVDF